MARAHHYRRRVNEPTELDVTTFLNLMVVLVPFLLITAVFSRIAVVELDMPTSSGAATQVEPNFRVEVIVRESGMEISNGKSVIARISKVDDEYDMPQLAQYMLALKQEYPDVNQASVLLEPTIPYDYLIQVMDIVRSAEIEQVPEGALIEEGSADPVQLADAAARLESEDLIAQVDETPKRLALFPEISVGEAP
jgi:biopolymer transport protein ExbD